MDNMAKHYEHEIPSGYEARIEGNKVIFEQKESEDERIRMDILEALRYGLACEESVLIPGSTTTLKEAIAYLEKQKEQKPAGIDEYEIIKKHITEDSLSSEVNKRLKECGWYVTYDNPAEWSEEDKAIVGCIACCLDGQFVTEAARKQCLEWFNKHRRDFLNQPKQEWDEEDEWKKNELLKYLEEKGDYRSTWYSWLKSLHYPQKQKWNDEDEKMLKDTIRAIHLAYPYALDDENPRSKNIDWLKGLEERFNLQPKQEWSQKDNEFADDAIACVTRCYERYCDNKDFYQSLRHNTLDIKRWLLNVRKRLAHHWKPSKEQIDALYVYLYQPQYIGNSDDERLKLVESLYNDLKKL